MRAERPGRHVEMTKGKGILGGGGDRKHEKDIKDTQNLEQKCHIDPNDRSHGRPPTSTEAGFGGDRGSYPEFSVSAALMRVFLKK